MITPTPVAIFDLDGTLVDTAPDLAAEINRLLHQRKLEPIDLGEARRFLGNGMRTFATRAFQARQAEISEQEMALFIDRYIANPVEQSRLYPDVAATLEQLAAARWRMAAYGLGSHRPVRRRTALTRPMLQAPWARDEARTPPRTLPQRRVT